MPVNLSIKNVPDALAERLRARAARNHRSLQRELMAILEFAAQGGHPLAEPAADLPGRVRQAASARLSIEALEQRAVELFPEGTPSSAGLIRDMRDGRYGAQWAGAGRNPGRR